MTKLITIEQVAPIFGVKLASLIKHRIRLGMPEPVDYDSGKQLFSEQEIIEFAKNTDIKALFKRMNKEEWQARKARMQFVPEGTFNVARLW